MLTITNRSSMVTVDGLNTTDWANVYSCEYWGLNESHEYKVLGAALETTSDTFSMTATAREWNALDDALQNTVKKMQKDYADALQNPEYFEEWLREIDYIKNVVRVYAVSLKIFKYICYKNI